MAFAFGWPRLSLILVLWPSLHLFLHPFISSSFPYLLGLLLFHFAPLVFAVLGMEPRPLHLLGDSLAQQMVPGILYPRGLFLGLEIQL